MAMIQVPEPTIPVLTRVPRNKDQNAALVYLASLSAKSGRRSQAQVLRTIADWLGGDLRTVEWGALRYAHTVAIKTMIVERGYSPATARKFISALRGTLKAAWRLEQMKAEDLAKAIDLGKIGGKSLPAGRYVSEGEIEKMFQVCANDKTALGRRDAALLAVLYGCGLRREEITLLDLEDYHPDDGSLLVHGKGGRDRLAYISNGIGEALMAWNMARGNRKGPLFLRVYPSGLIRYHRLTTQAVYNAVIKRAEEAGIEHFSPHSLRRSFCSRLLDDGLDISTVSKLAGHVSIATTQIYDRRGETSARAGAQLMSVPYIKPPVENLVIDPDVLRGKYG